MKPIRIDRRYLTGRLYNHRVALYFDNYWNFSDLDSTTEVRVFEIEETCERLLGPRSPCSPKDPQPQPKIARWSSYYKREWRNYDQYLITFLNPADMLMVIMATEPRPL